MENKRRVFDVFAPPSQAFVTEEERDQRRQSRTQPQQQPTERVVTNVESPAAQSRMVFDVFAPPGEAFVPEETLIERRRALEQLRVSTALQEAERAARLQAITRAAEREGQPSTEIYGHTSKLPPLQGRLSEIIEARTQTPARNVLDGVRIPSTLRPTMTPSVAPASQTPLGELITAATQARTQRDSAPAPTAPTAPAAPAAPTRVPTLPAPIEHPPLIDTLRQAQRQTQREAGLVRDAATTLGIAPRGRAAEKPPVTQPPATKKPPTPKDGEMGWAEVAGRSLRAGITQASANIMGLLRMPGRGVAEVLDLILPEHIYDIKDDPFIQAGDRMMEFYDESVAKQDEKLKGLTGAKKYLDLGLRPLPQVILAAIPGVGKVKGAVAAGKAAAAAKPTVAGKVTAAARAAAKRAAADPPVDIARMLPFGTLAGSGAARQAELEGATYLQQVLTGIFVGGGEMAAESIPFNHALRVIRRLGVDELVERGSRSLIREFGAAGLDFLRAGATEALEESAMVPWDRFVRRSVYAPEIPVTGEGGIFDIAPIIEGGIGGLAMATVLGALGMPAASASYVLARRAFRERQNLNTLVKELEEIMPQEMAAIRQAQEQGISIEDIDAVTEEDIAEAETTVAATVEDIAETTAAETTAEETADIEAEAGAEVPVVAAEAPVPTIADAQEVMATEAPVVAAEEEMADMDDIDDIDDGQPHLPPPVQPPAQRTPAAVTPAFAKQVKVGDRVRTSFSGDTLEVVDTSDGATVTLRTATGATMRAGRNTLTEVLAEGVAAPETAGAAVPPVADTIAPSTLQELQRQFIKVSPDGIGEYEAEALGSLIRGVAAYKGMSPDEYVRQRFSGIVEGGDPAEDSLFKMMQNDDRISAKTTGDAQPFVAPQRTVKAYKLFRTLKKSPGEIFPLFIGKTNATPIGEWIPAEYLPTEGFANRGGWHAGELPFAPHLMKKDGTMAEGRVWAEVEMPADIDWQKVANATKTKDVRGRVPDGGHYRFKTSKMQGGAWLIGGAIKVNRVLTSSEVKGILQERAPHLLLKIVDGERIASVEFGEDAKALIRAYKSPNVAVMSHELGHIFRRDLSNSDLIVVEDWAGVSEGEWTTEAEEKFADGFVEYLSEGNAPTPQLRNVFEQFKEWLSNLFKGMTPVQKKTLSAPVRQVFDKLISGEAQPADKHANLTALWNNAKGDSFARKRLDFMQNLPENITRAEARRWLDQNADDRGTAPEQVTVEQRLEEVSVLHDPDADRRNAWVVGDIVLDRNDATTRRAMANLGMAAVPGLRLQDAETAGLVRLMVHKGIIPQSDWDEYVQGLVRSGSVRGAQAGTPTVTPAAATVATPAAATVATPTETPTERPAQQQSVAVGAEDVVPQAVETQDTKPPVGKATAPTIAPIAAKTITPENAVLVTPAWADAIDAKEKIEIPQKEITASIKKDIRDGIPRLTNAQKVTFNILKRKGEMQEATGHEVRPGLVIHQHLDGPGWMVTHKVSGVGVTPVEDQSNAILTVLHLSNKADWSQPADQVVAQLKKDNVNLPTVVQYASQGIPASGMTIPYGYNLARMVYDQELKRGVFSYEDFPAPSATKNFSAFFKEGSNLFTGEFNGKTFLTDGFIIDADVSKEEVATAIGKIKTTTPQMNSGLLENNTPHLSSHTFELKPEDALVANIRGTKNAYYIWKLPNSTNIISVQAAYFEYFKNKGHVLSAGPNSPSKLIVATNESIFREDGSINPNAVMTGGVMPFTSRGNYEDYARRVTPAPIEPKKQDYMVLVQSKGEAAATPTAAPTETPKKEVKESGRRTSETHDTGRLAGEGGGQALEGTPPTDVQGTGEVGDVGETGVRGTVEHTGRVVNVDKPGDELPQGVGGREGELAVPAGRKDDADTGRTDAPVGQRPGNVRVLDGKGTTAQNFRFTEEASAELENRSEQTKVRDNIAAVRLVKQIMNENRQASQAEQTVLSKYIGWGFKKNLFDSVKPKDDGFNEARKEIKELLTEKEWLDARQSALYAHYTSATVVRAMYDALESMGFHGGRVLEPAMGIGYFFGMMPQEMLRDSWITGVEIESMSGNIAKLLFPQGNMNVMGYQNFSVPHDETKLLQENYYDLVISNVPFSDTRPFTDPRYDKLLGARNLHNYFFAKAIDQVRPGGLLAFITSRYTMDGTSAGAVSFREHMDGKADFLGAVRLHNETFKKIAGTSVVADIIFMRKRAEGDSSQSEEWTKTIIQEFAVEGGRAGRISRQNVNEYFVNNPDMVLGDPKTTSAGMYGDETYTVDPTEATKDVRKSLTKALKKLPKGIYRLPPKHAATEAATAEDLLPADYGTFPGTYIVKNKKLMFTTVNEAGELVLSPASKAMKVKPGGIVEKRILGMLGVRDVHAELTKLELTDANEQKINDARKRLNDVCDAFVKEFGYITSKANSMAFSIDQSYYKIAALEMVDKENNIVEKADMFRKRTISRFVPATSAETATEALAISLNERGRVDFEHMSRLTKKTQGELQRELAGLVYNDPEVGWTTADEYLSGNVREKLRIAEDAAKHDNAFTANVTALKDVQPIDLMPEEIPVTLGIPWIPISDVEAFLEHLFEASPRTFRLTRSLLTNLWVLEFSHKHVSYRVERSPVNNLVWGIPNFTALDIIRKSFNNEAIEVATNVRDEDGKTRRVVDKLKTVAAKEKQAAILKEFERWIWQENPARAKRLAAKYNNEYNNLRLRVYDGEHLTFPGMNPNITLEKHQKRAVWRILQGRSTLLAHTVGAGKTFEMVAAAMEMKRLGIARKTLLVSPNNLVAQNALEAQKLYPAANILFFSPEDMNKQNRKITTARIATGDWDLIIMPESSFGKLPMSAEYVESTIKDELNKIDKSIEELGNLSKSTARDVAKSRNALERKLREQTKKLKKEQDLGFMTFQETGIDALFVDESHNYKNLFYSTRMARIGSLGTQEGSMKAFDMLTKVNYLRSMHNGRGIVFASGTPISNTMAELYHLQRYLDPQALADRDIHSFDAWAQTFGRVVTSLELNPSGKGFRQKQRFAKFVNVAELLQMYRSFADILTHEMLVEILGDAVQLPKIAGGGAILQTAMPSAEVLAYIEELTARADDIRAGNVDAKRDNYLKIVGDGRLVALYPPLRGLPDYQGSKVDIVANNVFEIWENGKSEKLTQLLFLDLSTPKGKTKAQLHEEETGEDMEEEWDETKSTVYNVIRQRLINKGIPAKEIAFIHDYKTDAQKLALYDAMNAGSVRILMGSTAKMGVGMNVQKRLFALHHVDAPWRPSDVLQRVGRIVRRGNTNEEVYVFAYGTESTLDSLIWQILETKQRFIAQLERQNLAVRTMEDVDEMSLSFGQIKAALTGDETIITLAHLQQELTTLLAQEQAHRGSKLYAINAARHYEAELASENATIASYEESLKMRTETKGDNFTIELEGKAYDKRADAKAAFDALAQDVAALAKQGGAEFIPRVAALRARGFTVDSDGLTAKGGAQANVKVGKFAGGDLWFSLSDASLMAYVKLGGYHWAESSLASVEHVINGIESKLANLRRAAEEAEEKALKYTQLAREEEFPQSERLRAVKEQIATLEHLLQMDETEVVVISEGEDADADDDDGEVPFMGIPKKKWKPQSTAQRQARATTPSLALIPVEPETAVAAVTAPADPQPAKRTRQEIIRRRETILKLMDILDTPLRTGKIRKRGVLGVFKIHEELIRTKSAHAEDPRVVFHEAGHRVDKLFDYELTSTDRFDNELLETEYVLALKEKFPKMGDKELREEGFAEFFYFFLSKADEAKDKFPNFYDYFIEQLQTEPDLFAKLQDYQQLYEAYDSQDPVSKVLAAVGEPRKQRTSFRRAMMQVLSRVFDDLHPWQFFTKIMTGGRALPVDVDPYSLARLSRGSAGRALVLLRHGQYRWIPLAEGESAKGKVTEGKGANTVVFTKVGPSLKEIAESAGDEYVEFTAYLMALRARELEAIDLPAIQKKAESLGLGLLPELRKTLRTLEQQNKKETQEYKDLEKQIHVLGAYELRIKTLTELKEREIVSGMDIPAAEEVYQMYKDNKKFNDLQKQLRGWWAFIVQDSVDAGVISAASARTMEEMHWYYVPFKRVRDADERSSSGTSEAYGDLPSPVKRIYGGMRSIRDIWEQAGRDAYFFTAINDKNRALLAFADLANANEGMGAIMEKLPPPLRVTKIQLTEIKDTLDAAGLDTDIGNMSLMATVFSAGRWGNSKENTIVALRGGNPEFWRLDPDLYNSIMAYDKETVSMIAKLLRPFAQMMRTSAVLSPRFQATNPWRDQFWTAVTEPSFVPFIDLGKGIASIAGKDDWYLAFMHSGGAYSALANYDEYKHPAFTLRMKDKIKKYAVNFVTLQPLRGVASAIEESTKVSIFRRKLQAGATRRQAAFAARNAPVDFSVSGSGAKTWRAITPFFSAALTSNFKLATVFMQNPLKMLLRGVLFITLPTILLWLFNKDNPFYEELPNWRKDGFWHFPNLLGPRSNEGHAKTFIAMPIPHLAGFGFKVLTERILRAIYNDDHYAFEGVQDTFIGLVRPNMVPPAILPHIENWANIDTFTGRPIVPMREQMLAPNLQYGPHTTESAKLLGRAFGVSPRQVDNVINGLLPGLGALGIRGVDAVLEATGVADPVPRAAGGLRGLPILGEFISAPGMGGSATMDAFFMDYDTAQRVDRTDKAAVAQGEPLPPISEKEAFLLTQLPNMRRVDTMLGNIRKQVREIHADLNMSPNEKRRQIDILDLAMINLVRETYGKLPLPE